MASETRAPAAEVVEDVLHEDTQFVGETVHLTVDVVERIVEPGRVDFGGGELEEARTQEVPAAKRNPDDDYGWWTLEPGTYRVTYNESLRARDEPVRLETRPALLERGALHPTVTVRVLPRIPLQVGGAGLKLKENARVTVLRRAD
jgi:hypothetical protein